jgi:hypothetical protein
MECTLTFISGNSVSLQERQFSNSESGWKVPGRIDDYSLRGDSLYLRKIFRQTPCDSGTGTLQRIQALKKAKFSFNSSMIPAGPGQIFHFPATKRKKR